jgi:hypothetical protein
MPALKILFGLLGALFLGYGLLLLEKAYEIHRLKKLFLSTPIEKISTMNSIFSKVRGHVEQKNDTLKGPFSGQSCLYYKYQIMKGKTRKGLKRLKRASREIDFCIRDITGAIDISPQKARFIVAHHAFKGNELTDEGIENLKDLLSLKELKDPENYQIIEEHLLPDEEITIMGHIDKTDDAHCIKSGSKLPLLVVKCSDSAFVVLYSRAFYRLLLTSLCFLVCAIMDFQLLAAL